MFIFIPMSELFMGVHKGLASLIVTQAACSLRATLKPCINVRLALHCYLAYNLIDG